VATKDRILDLLAQFDSASVEKRNLSTDASVPVTNGRPIRNGLIKKSADLSLCEQNSEDIEF
jgi:hypothetical protein